MQPAPARVDARPTPEAATVAYALDAEDRITAANPAWDAFATENTGPAGGAVVGTSVWRHVADPTTRHLYALLFTRVRESGRVLRIPFRCDSPDTVREMSLEVAPAAEGALVVYARLLRQWRRDPVPMLDPTVPRTGPMLRLCGWCRRVDLDGQWLELEEAMATHRILCDAPLPHTTHGICGDCQRAVLEVLERDPA